MDELSLLAERLERAALADLHTAAPAPVRERLGLRLEEVDGVAVSIAEHDPSIMLNRAIGLGVEQQASRDTVESVRAAYDAAGIGRYFVHAHPQARPAELRDWLQAAGLAPYRGWMKFVRGREAPPAARSDLRVERIGPEHAGAFGRIVADAFDMTPPAAEALAALADRRGWHLYMSFAGDEPAGTGALFVRDEAGWLDFGATRPEFRRRGSQRALLARRLREAPDLGCRLLFTETGEAVPGDPQHSYRNIRWAGFREGGLRDNFVPQTGPST